MSDFFADGGPGYIADNATDMCRYCAYKVGDQFFEPLGFSFAYRWRDLGIFASFIGANLILLFVGVSFCSKTPRLRDYLVLTEAAQ